MEKGLAARNRRLAYLLLVLIGAMFVLAYVWMTQYASLA